MRRTGVSNAIVAGLVIAGIVVGAFGVYLTMPAGTTTATRTETTTATTTQPTTTIQTTTQTQTITQPTTTTQTTTCTTTATTSTGTAPIYNPAMLFGNYSKMTVSLNDTYLDNSEVRHTAAETISYDVLGRPLVNAQPYYKVNMTEAVNSGGVQGVASYIFWFAPNGTLATVQAEGTNYTGSQTSLYEITFLTFQVVDASWNPWASGSLAQAYVHQLNTTMATISGYAVSVAYYVPNDVPFTECGSTSTVNSELIGVGTVSGSTNKLFVYLQVSETNFGALNPTMVLAKVTAVTRA